MTSYLRDDVFVPGGQPTITYVERASQHIERELARAIASPNKIASLSGPTKTGKTVLCKKVLNGRQYVWVDGGKARNATDFWNNVRAELDIPTETSVTKGEQTKLSGEAKIKLVITAGGSQLFSSSETTKWKTDSLSHVLESMVNNKIVLVIDDFHYIPGEARVEILRNIKGSRF